MGIIINHTLLTDLQKFVMSAVLKNIQVIFQIYKVVYPFPYYCLHRALLLKYQGQNFKVRGAGANNVSSSSLLSAYSFAHSSLTLSPSRLKATGVASALRVLPGTKSQNGWEKSLKP